MGRQGEIDLRIIDQGGLSNRIVLALYNIVRSVLYRVSLI